MTEKILRLLTRLSEAGDDAILPGDLAAPFFGPVFDRLLARRVLVEQGKLMPDGGADPEGWTARDKFAAVIETAAMNEAELSEYCRQRGLYPEQLRVWRAACERANDWERAAARELARETKDDRNRIRDLERELARVVSRKWWKFSSDVLRAV